MKGTDMLKFQLKHSYRVHGAKEPTQRKEKSVLKNMVSITLHRMLDVILQEEEQSIQLKLPDPSLYIFAEDDSEDNIIFEDQIEDDGSLPVIRGGTLCKLVEWLTHHRYGSSSFIRVFLTTFRSFTTPTELLDLLIRRYDIPEPLIAEDSHTGGDDASESRPKQQYLTRDELKRFKKEYLIPVRVRVMNVLRHWVDRHFYDFTRDDVLARQLMNFFKRVQKTRTVKLVVENIEKLITKKLEAASSGPGTYTFNQPPPPIEWHLTKEPSEFSLLTLHPVEIGRQITLMQSEIFKSIRPSELVGSVWTKKDKEKLSPNALKMIRLSTLLTIWYETSLCEAQNFEERLATYIRIIDILMVLMELNNFNGITEIIGAINSSPIHRMHLIKEEFQKKSPARFQALQDALELIDRQYVKYKEKLRSINPPCIPFLGVYLRNILLTEEGNPDFLTNTASGNLINFSKRRLVAETTDEIQLYQNFPYNLAVDEDIRSFLENMDPFQGRGEKEMNDYLYTSSEQVEPRNTKKPPVFPRSNDLPLKSPGIKTGTQSKKQSMSSQFSVEVPAPIPVLDDTSGSIDRNPFIGVENSDEDTVFHGQDEEDAPPMLPPPPLLPKEPMSVATPAMEQPPPVAGHPPPLNKKQSFKQLPTQAIPGMTPIEEEEPEEVSNELADTPTEQVPAPVLPPRRSVSKSNAPAIPRGRTESAPALPPRKTPIAPRRSEGSATPDDNGTIKPPILPPRRSKK